MQPGWIRLAAEKIYLDYESASIIYTWDCPACVDVQQGAISISHRVGDCPLGKLKSGMIIWMMSPLTIEY